MSNFRYRSSKGKFLAKFGFKNRFINVLEFMLKVNRTLKNGFCSRQTLPIEYVTILSNVKNINNE